MTVQNQGEGSSREGNGVEKVWMLLLNRMPSHLQKYRITCQMESKCPPLWVSCQLKRRFTLWKKGYTLQVPGFLDQNLACYRALLELQQLNSLCELEASTGLPCMKSSANKDVTDIFGARQQVAIFWTWNLWRLSLGAIPAFIKWSPKYTLGSCHLKDLSRNSSTNQKVHSHDVIWWYKQAYSRKQWF